jgi:hypothetical protein
MHSINTRIKSVDWSFSLLCDVHSFPNVISNTREEVEMDTRLNSTRGVRCIKAPWIPSDVGPMICRVKISRVQMFNVSRYFNDFGT